MRLYRVWSALALASALGCSGSSTPNTAMVAAPGAAPAESAELDGAPDLTPVAAPEDLVGIATLRTPARSLDTLMSWTGLGLDWRAFLQTRAAAQLIPVLDLDAPIDAVASLDPKSRNKPRTLYAASIGLTSRQGALDAFRSLDAPVEQVEPGVQAVRPNAKTICFIAPALGKAQLRLVCGQDRESVEFLTPYLTRGNPSESTGDAALHLELRAEAPWRLFGDKTQFLKLAIPMLLGEVSIGNAEFDAALRETAALSVDELTATLADLKNLRLDVRLLEEPAELALVLGMEMRGSRSWLAHAFAEGEGRASVAPDSFWKLPLDAHQAAYQSPSPPESIRTALELVERLAQTGLGQLGASAAVRRDWSQALREALAVSGPVVSASGPVPAQLLGASPDAREQLRAGFGYTLVGAEDEANSIVALLERSLRLYEDSALRKGLAQRYGLNAAKLPKVQRRRGPARLPESHVYELSLPAPVFAALAGQADAKPGPGAIPVVLMTCREGQRTWVAASSYAQLAEERLAGVLSSGPEATLARRAGLEALRRDASNLAGFWTLAALQNATGAAGESLRALLRAVGPSDVPIRGRALARATGPSGEAEFRIPAQLFRDVASGLNAR